MKTINLRDFYSSIYSTDVMCEVPDEVAELLMLYRQIERAQRQCIRRHKAYFSLDRDDGIELQALLFTPSAQEVYEKKCLHNELCMALSELTEKQLVRLYAHAVLGMGYARIAAIGGVDESAVRRSISRATAQLRKKIQLF